MPDHLSWTSHLFRAFYAEGVRHIYISPGSRSTPLVLAAATHPGFHKHVVLDERSAAFQAVGTGKAVGLPALLICTSGTAAANYHPAVIEAKQSGIPLIVITADRPPHLRGTGSSQTIDQIKLFGDAAVMFHELGEPVHENRDYSRLTLLARQSVAMSTDSGGPVHINAPFRKPLEPSRASLESEKRQNAGQLSASWREAPSTVPRTSRPISQQLIELFNGAERPLLIAGPDEPFRMPGLAVKALSERLACPVLMEPGSHAGSPENRISHYDILLHSDALRKKIRPDLLIRTGDQPYSKSIQLFEAENRKRPLVQLLGRDTWQDSFGAADHRLVIANQDLDMDGIAPKDKEWFDLWLNLDSQAGEVLRQKLNRQASLTDGHVIRALSTYFENGWNVMVSNSFTVRDLALFSAASTPTGHARVNRGAAGIDGVLSTGLGICRATGQKTAVITGDLAFLHDSNALLNLKELSLPLLIIVINNRGGNIFRMLPVANEPANFSRYFETPQDVDLSHLAKAHKLPYLLIDSITKLATMPSGSEPVNGPLVIECKTNPGQTMELRRSLWNAGGQLHGP